MNTKHYILKKGKIVAVDLMTWAKWMEVDGARHVKREQIGPSWVSTVFLGIDHNFGDGPPILWETMVFGGKLDQEMDRCAGDQDQAEAMHENMVQRVCKAEGITYDYERKPDTVRHC
jgi:hypothetical protein